MSPTALSLLIYAVGLVQGAMLVWVLLRNPFARFASGGYIQPYTLPPFTDDLTKYADAALLKSRAEQKAKQDAKWKAFMANPTGGWRSMGQGGVIGKPDARGYCDLVSKKRHGEVVISKEEAAKLFETPAARQAILRVVARNGQRVER
jgi:hypothetical protein